MKWSSRFLIPVALALLLAVAAGAAEYAAGTTAELAALQRRLAPGDVVVLANGTWQNQALVLRGQGTEKAPITFRAARPGGVVLTGTSTLTIDGRWLVVSGFFVRGGSGPAAGITLRGEHNRLTETAMIGGTYKHFVRVFGVRNRIDHCQFEGKTSGEPTLQVESEPTGPNEHRIDHNYFGPRPPLGANGGETIRVGYSGQSMNVSRTLVEENLFEACDGEIEIISSKSCENVYRANTFRRCAGMLTLRHGNRCVVDGNFFLGEGKKHSGGVRIIGEGHVVVNNYVEAVDRGGFWITAGVPNSPLNRYFVAKDCIVAFNTVVDSAGPYLDLANGLGEGGRTLKPERITVANNLFVLGRGAQLTVGQAGADWRWEGNLVAPERGTEHMGPAIAAGVRGVADAGLVRGSDGLLRLRAGSVAIDAAVGVAGAVTTDFDGQSRGEKKDVGADEFSNAPVTQRPLTRADVGTAWKAEG
ncbi:polysaccharide lyase 6 family protein [Opitutus sp. ER46]|uniref:polysaccharide lyase 6 family protein n=1 Tax=Opitutus sp. ER46 TaxID=2161864 RepID=UPI000D30B3F7|nr:polysaccharide lyase 6 family protein [Opitutus sp. ER46]PTX91003.1 hypothetical protein DB354_20375 [Opitutus sp. ER46]